MTNIGNIEQVEDVEQIIEVEIARLRPHPRQDEFFLGLTDVELAELAEDIGFRGLRTPIAILKDGTIVCGHQRVAAAKILRWDTIEAYVLDASSELAESEVLDHLIIDNTVGRQNDPLTLARCYKELESRYETMYPDSTGEKRDVLAEKLNCGCTGRTLDRLKRLLELPIDMQERISRGTMNRSQGEALLRLGQRERRLAIKRIRTGESPKLVLHSDKPNRSVPGSASAPTQVLRQLLHGCSRIEANQDDFDTIQLPGGDLIEKLDAAILTLTNYRDRKHGLRSASVQEISKSLQS